MRRQLAALLCACAVATAAAGCESGEERLRRENAALAASLSRDGARAQAAQAERAHERVERVEYRATLKKVESLRHDVATDRGMLDPKDPAGEPAAIRAAFEKDQAALRETEARAVLERAKLIEQKAKLERLRAQADAASDPEVAGGLREIDELLDGDAGVGP